jgi:hypothetical protein
MAPLRNEQVDHEANVVLVDTILLKLCVIFYPLSLLKTRRLRPDILPPNANVQDRHWR